MIFDSQYQIVAILRLLKHIPPSVALVLVLVEPATPTIVVRLPALAAVKVAVPAAVVRFEVSLVIPAVRIGTGPGCIEG